MRRATDHGARFVCRDCGYALDDLDPVRCPECGSPRPRISVREAALRRNDRYLWVGCQGVMIVMATAICVLWLLAAFF